jgi:integrase/recombinase XerD
MVTLRTGLKPRSTATHHTYWKAIRSFFKWSEQELGTQRPDLALSMPRHQNKEVVPMTEEEIKKLLKACERAEVKTQNRQPYTIHRSTELRDKAIVLTLLDTGLRVGELCRLTVQDINLENGEVHVKPHHVRKTRPRTVFIGKNTRKVLWRYFTEREDLRFTDPAFAGILQVSVTPHSVLSMVSRLGKRAGVPGVHPHRFRHTFAVQYLRNGGDVFTLQRLLGHNSMEMVRRYLNLAKADDANAHRKASPVDNWRL